MADQNNGGQDQPKPNQPVVPPSVPPVPIEDLLKRYNGIKFAIEFSTKQNENVICAITKRQYRGRWSNANLRGRTADNAMASMPEIPGMMIVFDGSKRLVEVRDPLTSQENAKLLKEIHEVCRQCRLGKPDPEQTRKYDSLSLDGLNQWCYWARRWIDNEMADVKAGSVPSMIDIEKLPGRVERELFNTSGARIRYTGLSPEGVAMHGDREVPPYKTPKEALGTLA